MISYSTKYIYDKNKFDAKSNRKVVATEEKLIPLTHIYMTVHSPGLV
jgi:hypothetical protein